MKFWIYATSDNLDKYDLSKYNFSRLDDSQGFIEISTIEEILKLSKETERKLVIFDKSNHWRDYYLEENNCDGAIEIYDWYRE